jgi:hypothetical protein
MTAPATTIRLPDDLGDRLETYCAATGAVKNRVVALALRSYLGEEGVPALPVAPHFDELPENEAEFIDGLRHHLDARDVP